MPYYLSQQYNSKDILLYYSFLAATVLQITATTTNLFYIISPLHIFSSSRAYGWFPQKSIWTLMLYFNQFSQSIAKNLCRSKWDQTDNCLKIYVRQELLYSLAYLPICQFFNIGFLILIIGPFVVMLEASDVIVNLFLFLYCSEISGNFKISLILALWKGQERLILIMQP